MALLDPAVDSRQRWDHGVFHRHGCTHHLHCLAAGVVSGVGFGANSNLLNGFYKRVAENAVAAILTMLGWSVPSLGVCPCGACGGTEK